MKVKPFRLKSEKTTTSNLNMKESSAGHRKPAPAKKSCNLRSEKVTLSNLNPRSFGKKD
jgi:hypothetical protein